MRHPDRRIVLWLAAVVLLASACARAQSPASARSVAVPVTDLKAVAGTWTGVAFRQPGDRDEWLELTLREDGTYQGFSARQIGAFVGQGTLQVRGGNVLAVGRQGTAVMKLYERRGPVLSIDFTEANGVKYSAELRPKT